MQERKKNNEQKIRELYQLFKNQRPETITYQLGLNIFDNNGKLTIKGLQLLKIISGQVDDKYDLLQNTSGFQVTLPAGFDFSNFVQKLNTVGLNVNIRNNEDGTISISPLYITYLLSPSKLPEMMSLIRKIDFQKAEKIVNNTQRGTRINPAFLIPAGFIVAGTSLGVTGSYFQQNNPTGPVLGTLNQMYDSNVKPKIDKVVLEVKRSKGKRLDDLKKQQK